jgi:hypothetical protein
VKFKLERVHFVPANLKPGVLYVSDEFEIAIHLCACGCGTKIRTPLGPTEWSVEDTATGPTLSPSVGNWQEACKSHYWIEGGETRWAATWTPEQIAAGRRREEARRHEYYKTQYRSRGGKLRMLWYWIKERLTGNRRS